MPPRAKPCPAGKAPLKPLTDSFATGISISVNSPTSEIEDSAEEQQRRSFLDALGETQVALHKFEKTHDMPAVEAELADIRENADARERAEARRQLIGLMTVFETEILRPGAARWSEIEQLGDEVESRWPGQRLTTDLPHIPPGIFTTGVGLRSVPIWFREVICAAQPELFGEDDPVRQKIESMKAQRKVVIWHPLPPMWG
jgi:hypothetical protein